jgi:NADPH-dependent 2,4-dienoyl-CoA reductase/sulfur reductase-like enzyme
MECWANAFQKRQLQTEVSYTKSLLVPNSLQTLLLLSGMNGVAKAMVQRVLPKGKVPHVCIVGAGVSGLRCAQVLSEKGLKVTILEGRDRIGGRVNSPWCLGSYQNNS